MDEREKELFERWVDYHRIMILGEKTTVAFCKLKNGFEIIGTSACVNPEDFNASVGEYYAEKDALRILESHIGFYNQESGKGAVYNQ